VVLPGFPTSAIFTFHAFVAPVIRAKAGSAEAAVTVVANVPVRIPSELAARSSCWWRLRAPLGRSHSDRQGSGSAHIFAGR